MPSRGERRGQVGKIAGGHFDVTLGPQTVEWTALGQRREQRNRTSPVGDFNGFASLDTTEKLAGSLPQLSHTDACHVLLIAQLLRGRGAVSVRRRAEHTLRRHGDPVR